jgi:two-component system, NtrC family, sensor kinase
LTASVGAKVIGSLFAVMVVIFSLLGYLNIRLHRQDLETARLASAQRVSDVIKRSTTYYMLRNDREGLYRTIQTMAGEPGTVRVRILDPNGRIHYSTDPREVNRSLDTIAGMGRASLDKPQGDSTFRLRIYRDDGGARVLGITTPIENQPSCSNAACHAHPAGQQVLGVLDTNLSLSQADAQVAASSTLIMSYTTAAVLLVAVLSWLTVWWVVHKPIQALKNGTEHLSRGELGYQIKVQSQDEVGELAASFNGMSTQLRAANEQITNWAKTLEDRVEQKTMELRNAHDHVLHVEKMASVGKMAAVVAHEVNNPLSGILTYAKLLRRWVGGGETSGAKHDEALQCLDLIATESRRCGDLIKNLLNLSRTAPMNIQLTDLHDLMERCLLLVRHQLELVGIEWQLDVDQDLPPVECDPAQIEQVLLAMIMNAIDAMPHGGTLWLSARLNHDADEVTMRVRDDGTGISPEVLPHIFEPFVTTKEGGHGVGLGLAISRGIVERHGGRIEVESELGCGTTFTVSLPAHGHESLLEVQEEALAERK